MMSNYRLLVTDVDGTFVDSRQEVPEDNRGAAQRNLPMDQAIAALEVASRFDVRTHVYMDGRVYVARIDSVVRDYAKKDRVDCIE